MACRGVFFALTNGDEQNLLSAPSDEDVLGIISEIEERWDQEWLAEVDKAWDAMHRCLGDGTLGLGESPLSKCVLGGRPLHAADHYIVSYLSSGEVQEVSLALVAVDGTWLRRRYETLPSTDYDGPFGDDDYEYTWENFASARDLFKKAARVERAMVFTVDQ